MNPSIASTFFWLVLSISTAFSSAMADDLLDLRVSEMNRIIEKADAYLEAAPVTVTASRAERSEGGIHDFYSEGDYWWPDPDDPEGPYVRRDGLSNPDNFVAHRRAMVRLSEIVGTLVSAHLLTADDAYAQHALVHLEAWFADEATRMNPSLLYGQAIKGRVTGRSIGIIDTIHLVEVARGVKVLEQHRAVPAERLAPVKAWFAEYLDWLQTHPYGQEERVHPNNHGVCWSMQAAAFADLVGEPEVLEWIRTQFKSVYLAEMMAMDGSFPAELGRTKPYGYSLFVLDAMAMVAQIASTEEDDLWAYELPDGRGMRKGMNFLVPYMRDKSAWPYGEDVLYWDQWPVRHPSLLFAGLRYAEADWLGLWESLEADPETPEVLRNLPVRHPLLWVGEDRPPTHTVPDHNVDAAAGQVGATLHQKVPLAIEEIPQAAMQEILRIRPDFAVAAAERESKQGRHYLDIEGESEGSEIEFDLLLTPSGWTVVEIQRDLALDQVPGIVTEALAADYPDLVPRRIIESIQHGTGAVIYEFFAVEADGRESLTEIRLANDAATVIEGESTH